MYCKPDTEGSVASFICHKLSSLREFVGWSVANVASIKQKDSVSTTEMEDMETTLRRWCWCAPLLGKQLPDRGCIQPGLHRACMKISFKVILKKRRLFLSENLIFSVNQGVSAETSQPGEISQLLILIPVIKSRQSLQIGWKRPRWIFVCGCFDDVSYEMHEGVLNENYSCWLQKSQLFSAHLTVDVLA